MNEKIDLSEYEKVYWGISNSDSLFDFRKTNSGFAILTDSLIVQTINKDSVKAYKLSKFKTIYADDELNFLRFSIAALLAILTIYAIYFVPKGVDYKKSKSSKSPRESFGQPNAKMSLTILSN